MRFPVLGLWLGLMGLLAACGSDSAGSQTKEPLRLTVNLPPAYLGEAYTAAFTADGGIRPYKYSFDGTLPKGLTYADGRISGTPQEKGSFDLTVTVEDGNLSSRVQKTTLTVAETPPPQLEQVFPLAESADPFVYLMRVRNREARGFQMQLALKDLQPTLESLKTPEGLLTVSRYNPETHLLDLDAVFVTPKKDLEVLRLTLTPDKKLRPSFGSTNPLLAFYDKNGALVAGNPQIDRAPSQGKYTYADLQAIAKNWGRKLAPGQGTPAPAQPPAASAPAAPGEPTSAAQETTQAEGPSAPVQPEGSGESAQAPPAGAPASPQNSAQGQQNQPPQGQTPSPQPGQNPSPQPAQAAPQKLEGDLNGDGVVDQKDLDLLRSSYAWASVSGIKLAPANPQPTPPSSSPSGTPPAPSDAPPAP
ncbi:putative Ig domain-containing protein [Meiothermus granaticius]|uniref:putative Ig domain-containing protein n=1 Tax=Meiothermus granaticius TaxID=863370 RepID=UPI00118F24BB|nr:putative Ig domain-containing protein [Meiothermus granaticius]GEM86900.1 hypothetical protein MGR01S_15250 [Meiothermus granaticius NBRC 107808]